MLCMSASMLQPIIDGVVKDYNKDVLLWSDELKQHFEVHYKHYLSTFMICSFYWIVEI